MKAECKTIETRRYTFTAKEVYELCAEHIYKNYGVVVSVKDMTPVLKSRMYEGMDSLEAIICVKETLV